ncbi:MAG TPA: DUF1540 domain-containing protein [Nitrospirota bacterium]
MPRVLECSVTECSYNKDEECHALAIQVGGGSHPACDTFLNSKMKGGNSESVAGIGACKVSDCEYNKALECSAEGITVGRHEEHADCETYEPAK